MSNTNLTLITGRMQAVARYVRNSLKKSSMIISNMIGPVEKMSVANHPVKGFYFLVFGSPEVGHELKSAYTERVGSKT